MKHTPGPWTYRPNPEIDGEITDSDGRTLAIVFAVGNRYDGLVDNGPLLAAAPDLLAALEELWNTVIADSENDEGETCCSVCGRPEYLDCNPDEPCGRARAAIQKATGEGE